MSVNWTALTSSFTPPESGTTDGEGGHYGDDVNGPESAMSESEERPYAALGHVEQLPGSDASAVPVDQDDPRRRPGRCGKRRRISTPVLEFMSR